MKKKPRKKGKTGPRSSRRESRKSSPQGTSQVIHLTSSIPAPQSEIRAHTRRPEGPLSAAAVKCQELYVTHTCDTAGRVLLDRERLAEALAEVGMSSVAEQALFSLAVMAAADGHAVLFEAEVIAALEQSEAATTAKAS